jgi:uncharacterized protein
MTEAANLLGDQSSPYLRQHAHNPVHWRPWGSAALEEATSANKPILLSIGYAACHWCHVMAHECFEDHEVAALMNELYINIKVDREERPDIDQIYMAALGAMGEQGGWPLTMFLTPEGKPFWGGTYFPKHSHYGRPGFLDVLRSINGVWRNDQQRVEQNVAALTQHIGARLNAQAEETELDPALINQFASNIFGAMDPIKGGLTGSPKFPSAPFMDTIWLSWLRTGETTHRDMFLKSLQTMLQGGIYDHLGGGISRYSVDDAWLVPHFEKMLYDNAQLIRHATYAYCQTNNPLFRQRIEEIVAWLQREMIVDSRFASSLDADSEGEEGRFYVWQDAEIPATDEFQLFREVYDVSEEGNWEGKNILNRLRSTNLLDNSLEESLKKVREKLFNIREMRVPPGRDEKALTDWNGLMIRALAEAGRAFEKRDWVDIATDAYRSISESMVDGRLPHSVLGSSRLFPALSSDYAAMINAALSLHQATRNKDFINDAKHWKYMLDLWHKDRDGLYALSANDNTDTIIRVRGDQDEAVPSATSQIIEALARLALITGDEELRQHTIHITENALGRILQQRYGQAGILNSAGLILDQVKLVVVTPDKDHPLMRVADRIADPRRIDLWIKHGKDAKIELVPGGGEITINKPAAFLCRGFVCLPPVETEAELEELLRSRF